MHAGACVFIALKQPASNGSVCLDTCVSTNVSLALNIGHMTHLTPIPPSFPTSDPSPPPVAA